MHFRYVQKISVRKSTILCKQLENSFSILNKTQDLAVQSATSEQCRRRRATTQQPSRSRSMPAREISKSRFQQPDYSVTLAKQASSTTHLMKAANGQNPLFHTREYSTFIEKLKSIFGIGATAPPPLQRAKDDIVTKETPQNPPATKKVEDDIDFEKAMGASKPKICPNKSEDAQFSPYNDKLDGPAEDSTFFSEERICKECPELRAYKLQKDYDLKHARDLEKEAEEPDSKDMYEAEEGQAAKEENTVYTSSKDEDVACDKSLKCKRKAKQAKGEDCDAKLDQQLNYAVLSDKEKTLIDGQYSTQNPLVGNCTAAIQLQDWNKQARHINTNDLCGHHHAKREEMSVSLDNRSDEVQLVDVTPLVRQPQGRKDNGLRLCGISDKLASDANMADCTREEASLSTLDGVLASLREIETKQKRLDEDGADYKDDGIFASLQHQAFVRLQTVDSVEFPAPHGASVFIPDVIEHPEKLKRGTIDHQNLPSPTVYSQLPAVIPQVATHLALPDFKRELKREIKKEIRAEMKNEVKREVTREVKQEVKYDLTKDFKDNLKQDLKMECLMEEVKREMKTDLSHDLREDLKNEVKDDLRLDLQKDFKDEIQQQVKAVFLDDSTTIVYADEEDDRKGWRKNRKELSDKVKNGKEDWDEEGDLAAEATRRHAYEIQQDANVVGSEIKKTIEETDWEGKLKGVQQTTREVADEAKDAQDELEKLQEKIDEEKKKRGGNDDFSEIHDVVRLPPDELIPLLALKVDKDINIQRIEEDADLNSKISDQKVVEDKSPKQQQESVVEEQEVKKEPKNLYESEEFTTESLRRELQLMKCSLGHSNIGVKFFDGITGRVSEKPPAVKVRLNKPEPMSYQVGADNLLKQIKKLQESKIKSTRRESMLFIEQVKDSLKWDFGEKYTKEVIQINPDLKTSTTRILPQDPTAPYSQIYVKLNDFKIMSVQADVRKKDGRVYTGFLKENVRKLLSPLQNLTDIQKRDTARLSNFEHYTSGLLLPLPQISHTEEAEFENDDPRPGEPERNLKQRSRIPIRDPSGDLRIQLDFFQKRPPNKPGPRPQIEKAKTEKPKAKGFGGFFKNLMKTVETTFSPPPPPKPPQPPCKRPPRPPPPPPSKKPPELKAAPKVAAKAEAKKPGEPEKKEAVDLAKMCPPPPDAKKAPCPKIQDIPLPKPKEEEKAPPKVQAGDAKDEKKPCKKPWEEHVCAQGSLDKKDQQNVKDYKAQEAKKIEKKDDPKDKKVGDVKASDKKPEDPKQAKDQKPANKCDKKPEELKPVDPCAGDISEKSLLEKICGREPPKNNNIQLALAKKAKEKALEDKELEDKKRRMLQYLEPKDIPCNPTVIDTSLLTNPCCRKFPNEPVEGHAPGQFKFVKSNFERGMLKEEKLLKEQVKPVSSAQGVIETEQKTLCNIRGTALKATQDAAEASEEVKMCIHDKKVSIHDCPICRKSQILNSPPRPTSRKSTCKIGKCRKKGSKEPQGQSSICAQLETASMNAASTCVKKLKRVPAAATQKCPKPQFDIVCEKPKVKMGKPGLCGVTCYMKSCARKKKPPPAPPKMAAAAKPGTCAVKKKPKKAHKAVQQTPKKVKVVAILDEAIQQQRAKKCFRVKEREGKSDDCIKVVSACEKKVLDEERRKQLEKELAERKIREKELTKMKHTPWVPVKVRVSDNKFVCKKPFPAEKRKIKEEEERVKTKRHHVLPDLSSKYQSPRFSKKCDEKKEGAQAGGGESKK